MKFTKKNLEILLRSPEISRKIFEYIMCNDSGFKLLQLKPLNKLDADQVDLLSDTVLEVLYDLDLPAAETYEAEQVSGVYYINIMGVPGAYYIETADRDNMGYFETLEEAREALKAEYGEFTLPE